MNIYDYFYANCLNGYMVDYQGNIINCTDDGFGLRLIAITMRYSIAYNRKSGKYEEHGLVPVLFDTKEDAAIFAQDLRAAIAFSSTVAEFITADIPINNLRPIGNMLRNKLTDNPRVVEVLYGRSPDIYNNFRQHINTELFDYLNGHEKYV